MRQPLYPTKPVPLTHTKGKGIQGYGSGLLRGPGLSVPITTLNRFAGHDDLQVNNIWLMSQYGYRIPWMVG